MNIKRIKILYWTFTGLFAFFMISSAIPDVLSIDMAVKGFTDMGVPTYLLPFLGIAKLLGVIAILIPGSPRIKEWAYAGLIFDLCGAIYCIMRSTDSAVNWLPVLIPLILGFCSYFYYHKKTNAVLSGIINPKQYGKVESEFSLSR